MIFYFSGTGNTEWVAKTLASATSDTCVFVPEVSDVTSRYSLADGERLGFVFPVYSWGMPMFFEQFVRHVEIDNVSYVYFVCTCGDDIGLTDRVFSEIAKSKGWRLSLAYSVQMPNTYVCLPGFDVDTKECENNKLNNAESRLKDIIRHLTHYNKDVYDIVPGAFPWLKSYVIRPLFNRFLITSKYFRFTEDCKHCGVCVNNCPMNNISLDMTGGGPVWGNRCLGCLRCYHICPANAVQYGLFTKGKGQYCYKK